ncbi:cytochrome P450 [Streptomyces catenulae]|uniref:Cytochrome P450 n=1 Tax=Streptomyces catenulae TaxID=66875 RepID=A0ABV2Z683_9ACTN|nr:cytochrome P450 [Streptomyces catenulae]
MSEQPVPAFKPYEGKAAHPWEQLAADRARCPIVHSPELDSVQVTSYEAVKEIGRNHEAFSCTYSAAWPLEEPVPEELQVFTLADPPRHTRQRRLIVRALSASRINRMRPFTERTVNDLIDGLAARGGSFDLVTDFASPVSETHISELLGIPEADREYVLRTALLPESTGLANTEGLASPELEAWSDYLRETVRTRRAAGPGADDLTTTLCFAEENGDRFAEREIGLLILGLIAGNASTGAAIGNLVRALEQHPDQKTAYLGDIDGLTETLVEEGLRYDGPILGLYRRTLKEAELPGGHVSRPGERIYFSLGAANHDPEIFDRPDELRLDRDRKELPASMAFGYGVHHCIGMNLGRLQAEVALSTLYRRLPGLRLRPGFTPEQVPGPMFRSWTSLEMVHDGPVLPRTDRA